MYFDHIYPPFPNFSQIHQPSPYPPNFVSLSFSLPIEFICAAYIFPHTPGNRRAWSTYWWPHFKENRLSLSSGQQLPIPPQMGMRLPYRILLWLGVNVQIWVGFQLCYLKLLLEFSGNFFGGVEMTKMY